MGGAGGEAQRKKREFRKITIHGRNHGNGFWGWIPVTEGGGKIRKLGGRKGWMGKVRSKPKLHSKGGGKKKMERKGWGGSIREVEKTDREKRKGKPKRGKSHHSAQKKKREIGGGVSERTALQKRGGQSKTCKERSQKRALSWENKKTPRGLSRRVDATKQ